VTWGVAAKASRSTCSDNTSPSLSHVDPGARRTPSRKRRGAVLVARAAWRERASHRARRSCARTACMWTRRSTCWSPPTTTLCPRACPPGRLTTGASVRTEGVRPAVGLPGPAPVCVRTRWRMRCRRAGRSTASLARSPCVERDHEGWPDYISRSQSTEPPLRSQRERVWTERVPRRVPFPGLSVSMRVGVGLRRDDLTPMTSTQGGG